MSQHLEISDSLWREVSEVAKALQRNPKEVVSEWVRLGIRLSKASQQMQQDIPQILDNLLGAYLSESQQKIIEVEANKEVLVRREAEKRSPNFPAQRKVAKYLLYEVGNMYLPGEATIKDGVIEVAVCYDFGAQAGKKQVGRISVDANTYDIIAEKSDTAAEIRSKRRELHSKNTP
ncbi:hypothetical protein IH992_24060 [Candidatus Poribacteria bacterium]|nr:hypothetical protein [Candidatus Poribacteria bacterium]